MNNETLSAITGSTGGTLLCFFGLTLSVGELQAIFALISTILGLILTLITFVTKVIIPFIKKCKKAKEDGKVTIDEIEDIANDVKENIEDFQKNDLKK